jgi:serine/threonine-protein kinase
MTQAGMILGTAAYMSPEQAKGRAADRRSDIWAFGCVLYEMLTGTRAFEGGDVSDTLAYILTCEPDWTTLPADTPPPIRRLLRRCLEKDRKRRLDSAAAAQLEIDEALTAPPVADGAAAQSEPAPRSAWGRALPWTVAASMFGLAIASVLLWAPWRTEKPVDRPLVRLDVDLGADVSLPPSAAGSRVIIISPDGTRLVYASGTPVKLFTRRLDQPNAAELPGTLGAFFPLFSSDGHWVGFATPGKLNKIAVEGGAVVPLADIVPRGIFAGASWGEDGSIVVSEAYGNGLLRIPAAGGPPEMVAPLSNGEIALALPQILPGGKAILFAADSGGGVDTVRIEVITLADRRRKIVARGGTSPRYLPTSSGGIGHLVYVNKATLFAIPFDLDKLETRGTAVPVLNDVGFQRNTGAGHFDVSRTGTLIYRRASGVASEMATVQWMDPSGKKEPLLAKPGAYQNASLSPDGRQVALTVAGLRVSVSVYDAQHDILTPLSSVAGLSNLPRWSPDGQYIVFWSGGNEILQTRADGAGKPQPLTQGKAPQLPSSFTANGKRLAYVEGVPNTQIWTVTLEEDGGDHLKAGKPEQWLTSVYNMSSPEFSPDGRWLAYQSTESGQPEVYVRAFSQPGRKWQISNSGGTTPRWLRNKHELVYQSGDQVMTARYTVEGDVFEREKPQVWIAKLGGTLVGVAPDDRRVAVLTPVVSADAPKQEHEVVILQNFFDELRRRVPVEPR